ncbi:hypothetical protein LINPERPRIM_LOCUS15550 [Linum perenne]
MCIEFDSAHVRIGPPTFYCCELNSRGDVESVRNQVYSYISRDQTHIKLLS